MQPMLGHPNNDINVALESSISGDSHNENRVHSERFDIEQPSQTATALSYSRHELGPLADNYLGLMSNNSFDDFLASSCYQEPGSYIPSTGNGECNSQNEYISFDNNFDLSDTTFSSTSCAGPLGYLGPSITNSQAIESSNRLEESIEQKLWLDFDFANLQSRLATPSNDIVSNHTLDSTIAPAHVTKQRFTSPRPVHNALVAQPSGLASMTPALPITNQALHEHNNTTESSPIQALQSQLLVELTPAPIKLKRRRRRKPPPPPEVAAARHLSFLQRNREAASKCRTKKKHHINGLEAEEQMGRQMNVILKDEFKEIMKEVLALREQVEGITCDEDCEGCGEFAPMGRHTVLAASSDGASREDMCSDRESTQEEEEGTIIEDQMMT